MAAPILKGSALARQRVLGLVFLVVIVLLVGLTVALYQKRFTASDTVLLEADRIGNQLTPGADVKLRGLIVGRVKEVRTNGNGATLELAMEPDKTGMVPADVRAQLLPKTLFGEKFVALIAPERTGGARLEAGDVIDQDRSTTALETEKVLDDLLPLLQTLRPQQLSQTLNAVSGALRGRGERTGQNLAALDTYLSKINPEMPGIQDNIRGLADLAENYDEAAPDVLAVLDNFSALSRNLVEEQQQLSTFLAASVGSTAEVDRFLRTNEQRLVRLAADSRASLGVYARYSPEFPCLAAGLVEANKEVSATFGGRQPGLHITLEVPVQDNGPFVKGDEPRTGDDGGPTCRGLPPNKKEIPFPFYRNAIDGYRDGQPVDPRTGVFGAGGSQAAAAAAAEPARYLAGDDDLTRAVVGAVTGKPSDEVPDIAVMLFGPMARGTTVRLS
ncbi:MAG: virulence factor Mce family protein [Frankiales bacterium]|nr:virulence factor Mce family protein [Frankiales bacterium]